MSDKKENKSVNVLRGKRLQEIREFKKKTDKENIENKKAKKNWTREDVAEKMKVSVQTIKDYEKGRNTIDEGVAKDYAKLYNASFEFIMGYNDDMLESNRFQPKNEHESIANADKLIIWLIESMGIKITFNYASFFNAETQTIEKGTFRGHKLLKEKSTSIYHLENFSFSDYKCYLIDSETNTPQSIILLSVNINDETQMTFSDFAFYISELKDSIYNRINHVNETRYNMSFYNAMECELLEEIRDVKNGLTKIPVDKVFDEIIDRIKKEHGEDSIHKITDEKEIEKIEQERKNKE